MSCQGHDHPTVIHERIETGPVSMRTHIEDEGFVIWSRTIPRAAPMDCRTQTAREQDAIATAAHERWKARCL